MNYDSTFPWVAAKRPATDGWLGTPDFPGYRAGNVVAWLNDLPEVYPEHCYFDVVLLDGGGRLQDSHSGPCYAIPRQRPPHERSSFVRVVAELLRHAASRELGFSAMGQALAVIREQGVDIDHIRLAAQLLDDASSDAAVIASLNDLLELSLGAEEAVRSMSTVVADLAQESGWGALEALGRQQACAEDAGDGTRTAERDLTSQVSFVVATVGKARARRYLRAAINFDLLPMPQMLGV
jgi:hypothetical protein